MICAGIHRFPIGMNQPPMLQPDVCRGWMRPSASLFLVLRHVHTMKTTVVASNAATNASDDTEEPRCVLRGHVRRPVLVVVVDHRVVVLQRNDERDAREDVCRQQPGERGPEATGRAPLDRGCGAGGRRSGCREVRAHASTFTPRAAGSHGREAALVSPAGDADLTSGLRSAHVRSQWQDRSRHRRGAERGCRHRVAPRCAGCDRARERHRRGASPGHGGADHRCGRHRGDGAVRRHRLRRRVRRDRGHRHRRHPREQRRQRRCCRHGPRAVPRQRAGGLARCDRRQPVRCPALLARSSTACASAGSGASSPSRRARASRVCASVCRRTPPARAVRSRSCATWRWRTRATV